MRAYNALKSLSGRYIGGSEELDTPDSPSSQELELELDIAEASAHLVIEPLSPGVKRGDPPPAAGATVPLADPSGEELAHTWSRGDATSFRVRSGPNYRRTGAKESSLSAFYDAAGVDIFTTCKRGVKADRIGEMVNVPEPPFTSPHASVPSVFIINMQLPLEDPTMFGVKLDGPTVHCVFYFTMTEETAAMLAGDLSEAPPSLKLLIDYCEQATDDPDMRGRFKALGVVNNIESVGLPSMLASYNGKPVLVTRSGLLTRGGSDGKVPYMEMDCNVRHWCYLARKGLHVLLPRFGSMSITAAFVIEGREDSEMPERLLGCCNLTEADIQRAIPIDEIVP